MGRAAGRQLDCVADLMLEGVNNDLDRVGEVLTLCGPRQIPFVGCILFSRLFLSLDTRYLRRSGGIGSHGNILIV